MHASSLCLLNYYPSEKIYKKYCKYSNLSYCLEVNNVGVESSEQKKEKQESLLKEGKRWKFFRKADGNLIFKTKNGPGTGKKVYMLEENLRNSCITQDSKYLFEIILKKLFPLFELSFNLGLLKEIQWGIN